jgi:hypothetical protein
MQLQTIRDEVRTRLGLSANDGLSQNAALTSLVNAALRQVSLMRDWPWLEKHTTVTVSPGNATVTAPADFRKVSGLSYEDRDLPFRQPRQRAVFHDIQAPPVAFTRRGSTIEVLPEPDTSYTLNLVYTANDVVLSGNTDQPLLPDWAVDLLIAQTCLLVARRYRNQEQIMQYLQERDEALRHVQDELVHHVQGYTPRRTGIRAGLA